MSSPPKPDGVETWKRCGILWIVTPRNGSVIATFGDSGERDFCLHAAQHYTETAAARDEAIAELVKYARKCGTLENDIHMIRERNKALVEALDVTAGSLETIIEASSQSGIRTIARKRHEAIRAALKEDE